MGRFELADGGTLFLDEVGEIPPALQAKLLRVLQKGHFERAGDERTRRMNVRTIAATNRDLEREVEAGRFRQDLYYRLSLFPIELPPLRDRKEDIAPLAALFLRLAAQRLNRPTPRLTASDLRALELYDSPGNVRELSHVIERALILTDGRRLRLDQALPSGRPRAPHSTSVPVASTVFPALYSPTPRSAGSSARTSSRRSPVRTGGSTGAAAPPGFSDSNRRPWPTA